jgi:biopolymer transport protein ExbD
MEIDFKSPSDNGFKSDLTPLIDVIFQLLVFFILTSSFLYPNLDLVLPQTGKQEEQTEKQPTIVINLDKHGEIYLNSNHITGGTLETSLREQLQAQPKQRVHFRADKSTPYEQVLNAMVAARNAGAHDIYFIHEEK